jgi:hypothetical protein
MAQVPEPQSVEVEDEFIHVHYADPDDFETIRPPQRAITESKTAPEGSQIRTGMRPDSDEWEVLSVLIPRDVGEENAREKAAEVIRTMEE